MIDQRDDRERLAEASYRKRAAQHKGRAHFRAFQKRQRAAARRKAGEEKAARNRVIYGRYVERVRAFWAGLGDHPRKP